MSRVILSFLKFRDYGEFINTRGSKFGGWSSSWNGNVRENQGELGAWAWGSSLRERFKRRSQRELTWAEARGDLIFLRSYAHFYGLRFARMHHSTMN